MRLDTTIKDTSPLRHCFTVLGRQMGSNSHIQVGECAELGLSHISNNKNLRNGIGKLQRKMKKINIKGKYHSVCLKVVGKLNLTKQSKKRNSVYTMTKEAFEFFADELLFVKNDNESVLNMGGYVRISAIKGGELAKRVSAILADAAIESRSRLKAIKSAFSKAHYNALQWANGKLRVIRRFANKVVATFEELFCFDVRQGKTISLA